MAKWKLLTRQMLTQEQFNDILAAAQKKKIDLGYYDIEILVSEHCPRDEVFFIDATPWDFSNVATARQL